jgi:hypothetical protein
MNAKQTVLSMIERLPDDCTLEDIEYHFNVLRKIEMGLQSVERGEVLDQSEIRKVFDKKFSQ